MCGTDGYMAPEVEARNGYTSKAVLLLLIIIILIVLIMIIVVAIIIIPHIMLYDSVVCYVMLYIMLCYVML